MIPALTIDITPAVAPLGLAGLAVALAGVSAIVAAALVERLYPKARTRLASDAVPSVPELPAKLAA